MPRFHVLYYYLATGMEGLADEKDFGAVEASSPKEACKAVALREYPIDKMYGPGDSYSTREFFLGCLSAVETP